jgi:hypothetical protein
MHGVSGVYYAMTIKMADPNSHEGERHNKCTVDKCSAPLLPLKPLHMHRYCHGEGQCRTETLNEDKLHQIITSGLTPLVTFTLKDGLQLDGYDLTSGQVQFGAISHSWSECIVDCGVDARGKNDRRMLRCQVLEAQETFNDLFKQTEPPVPFWVDVLCLPRTATTKINAIKQLHTIYTQAGTVLVWDKDLLTRPKSAPENTIQMNIRIRTGEWGKRLWTLQETVLAKDIVIQFQDGIARIRELQQARDQAKNDASHEYHHVWRLGNPFSGAIWSLRTEPDGGPGDRVERAWQAIQFRSACIPADEPLILANILGLDVSRILAVEDHRDPARLAALRMARLLDLIDEAPDLGIPSGLVFLFSSTRPPLRLPGYGWAPSTWRTRGTHAYPLHLHLHRETGGFKASMLKQGLLVRMPGMLLHCPTTPIADKLFWVSLNQCFHRWFRVRVDIGHRRGWAAFWGEISRNDQPCIVMSTRDPHDRWEVGALAVSRGTLRQGTVRRVKFLCKVWVRLETNGRVVEKLRDNFRRNSHFIVFGERLEPGQEWCIDGGAEDN